MAGKPVPAELEARVRRFRRKHQSALLDEPAALPAGAVGKAARSKLAAKLADDLDEVLAVYGQMGRLSFGPSQVGPPAATPETD